jgi:hypothetical protein
MGRLVLGAALLFVALMVRGAAVTVSGGRPATGGALRQTSLWATLAAIVLILSSADLGELRRNLRQP